MIADILDRKLVFVTGKGGVGKSAATASLARLAARRGRRVLTIGMTDGLGLAIHFGVARLTYEPTPVHAGIDAIIVDRAAALDEYLKVQVRVPQLAPTRQFAKALDVLVDTAPGVREIISVGKPVFEVWQGNYDLVLVDAPPLGQVMSYLRAPATIARLVPAGIVLEQASAMAATLADPGVTSLVMMTLAEELPVVETLETLQELESERLVTLGAVATNRLLPPPPADADAIALLPTGVYRDVATLHHDLYDSQQRWLAELPAGPRLPYLFGTFTPGEVAARLADAWEET